MSARFDIHKPAVAIVAAALAVASASIVRCNGQGDAPPATRDPSTGRRPVNPKLVTLYEVPLVCPAVPQIGCGSASKPLLLELEGKPAVSEAWLNRAGTIVAVVWSGPSKAHQRAALMKTILEERQLTAKELKGTAREQALREFQSGTGWYRGADVDRLSEEEAGVIAARWVGKVREKVALDEEKAQAVQEGFTSAIKRKLTCQSTRAEARQEMLRVCREHLDPKDVNVLLEAFKVELGTPPGEK